MPVQTRCPSCSTAFNVPESMVGKKVRCRDCKEPFEVVPDIEATSVEPEPEPTLTPTRSPRTASARGRR